MSKDISWRARIITVLLTVGFAGAWLYLMTVHLLVLLLVPILLSWLFSDGITDCSVIATIHCLIVLLTVTWLLSSCICCHLDWSRIFSWLFFSLFRLALVVCCVVACSCVCMCVRLSTCYFVRLSFSPCVSCVPLHIFRCLFHWLIWLGKTLFSIPFFRVLFFVLKTFTDI